MQRHNLAGAVETASAYTRKFIIKGRSSATAPVTTSPLCKASVAVPRPSGFPAGRLSWCGTTRISAATRQCSLRVFQTWVRSDWNPSPGATALHQYEWQPKAPALEDRALRLLPPPHL